MIEKQNDSCQIFNGESTYFYLSDVHHLEILSTGGFAILQTTRWNTEKDDWENPVYIGEREIDVFKKMWHEFKLAEVGNNSCKKYTSKDIMHRQMGG